MTLPPLTAGAPSGAPLRRVLTCALAAALVTAIAGCSSTAATARPAATAPGTSTFGTTSLDPGTLVPSVSPAPTRRPVPQLAPVPAPGTVRLEQGPFTDRLAVTGLALQGGSRVVGTVANTVDVSELILLQVQADFYDGAGRLLGSGTASYADAEFADTGAIAVPHGTGLHDDGLPIAVTARPALTGAVSAVVTVPQLVNE